MAQKAALNLLFHVSANVFLICYHESNSSVTVTYSASIYIIWIDDWFANVYYPLTTEKSMLI